jgi:ferredoxin-NADP reductase
MSTAWLNATVVSTRDVTPSVREFLLSTPHDFTWQAGAHIAVEVALEVSADDAHMPRHATRHYSLLPCEIRQHVRIAVKRIAAEHGGRGGSQALWRLQAGQELRISAPREQFTLDFSAPQVLLVAGGIGVTPLVSMAQALARRGTDVRMVYGAREVSELAYVNELRDVLQDRLQTHVGQSMDADALIASLQPHAQMYVCGPSGLLQSLQTAWQRAQRPMKLLRFENFGAPATSGESAKLHLPRHALSFECPPEQSLLQAIRAQGIAVLSGCERGECGLCALQVVNVQGRIEHRDVFFNAEQKSSDAQICICVSRVHGKISIDTAWRPDPILPNANFTTPQPCRASKAVSS